ncbi:MAG TPA: AIPR family protein [Bacteroidia bacterium]|nr:AIPR family protein [Bacteroidia bacterium]
MDKKFEDIIKDGMTQVLIEKGLSFNAANTRQLGKSLTEFYIREIGIYLNSFNEDQIEEGLEADGKGDLNIDFVYKYENDEYFILQSKFKGSKNSVKPDEIAGFFGIHSKINDKKYFEEHANPQLQSLLEDYNEDCKVNYFFITNDKFSKTISDDFERGKKENMVKYENVNYELSGFTELKRDFKIAASQTEAIPEEVIINIEKVTDIFTDKSKPAYLDLSGLIDLNKKYYSILTTIKGSTLKNLWSENKASLFSYNIRGYLGDNPINKKMKHTLDHEPEKFYFYNNGISAICTEIIPIKQNGEVHQLKCKNFQIINGAQTATTIGKYSEEENLKQVRVLLRITKAEDYKKEKGLNKNIITYNNSQTVIKASDFRSNDEIQIFLENQLSDFMFHGARPFKKVKYLRKRIKT